MDRSRTSSSLSNEVEDTDESTCDIIESSLLKNSSNVISCSSSDSDYNGNDDNDASVYFSNLKSMKQNMSSLLSEDDNDDSVIYITSNKTQRLGDTEGENDYITTKQKTIIGNIDLCNSSQNTTMNDSISEQSNNDIYKSDSSNVDKIYSVDSENEYETDINYKKSPEKLEIFNEVMPCQVSSIEEMKQHEYETLIHYKNSPEKLENFNEVMPRQISSTEVTEISPFIDLTDNEVINNGNDPTRVNNNLGVEAQPLLAEKKRLQFEIDGINENIKSKESILKSVNVNILPDKGVKLKVSLSRDQRSLDALIEQIQRVDNKINLLSNKNNKQMQFSKNVKSLPSANLEEMGKKALETYRIEQSLTVNSLRKLHNSLKTCPPEETIVSDPTHLRIPLMTHQKQALAWLLWREKEAPAGGILADDMGLGKTLTMLSLIIKQNEIGSDNESSDDEEEEGNIGGSRIGGTLIICPSSLLGQWESEIKSKVKSSFLSYHIFHGSNRESKARRLAKPDIIITTYSIIRVEYERNEKHIQNLSEMPQSVLYSIKWRRIILDEAHVIRNHETKTALAIFQLKGKHRWALTGTPIHNKTQDLFALLKFLRCKPFDDINVWKKWVEAKDETGLQRLNMLTKSLMLRRTKAVLLNEKKIDALPEKESLDILVQLNKEELTLYENVSNFSKTLLGQLLYQRAEKENLLSEGVPVHSKKFNTLDSSNNPFSGHPALDQLFKKVVNMNNIQTHTILVLLLRLRQICCHPALMKSMIETETLAQDGIQDEDKSDNDLLEKMSSLSIDNEKSEIDEEMRNSAKLWNINNPIFEPNWKSSKIQAIIDLIENSLLKTDDKIVIVSQWTSMLDILLDFLKKNKNFKCDCLSGKVPVRQRMQIIDEFNRESSNLRVLLLSLTAGGTGLNLVGGNHLILTDLHWNPQLEAQACDRIYRVGQKKPVKIYKFMCSETIEERIKVLQQQKLEIANNLLSGSKMQVSKLSLNDLKMLFDVKHS